MLINPQTSYPSLWASDKALAVETAIMDGMRANPAGIVIEFGGGNFWFQRGMMIPSDERVTIRGNRTTQLLMDTSSAPGPLITVRAAELPNPGGWPSWLHITGLMLRNDVGPCIASGLTASGNRTSLKAFSLTHSRLTADNHYGVYMPDMSYSIRPEFFDLDFGPAGAIYWDGEGYSAWCLQVKRCRFHAGTGAKAPVGPGFYIAGAHLSRFQDVAYEGGATGDEVAYRAGIGDPDRYDRRRTLGLLLRNPGPRGTVVDGIHDEIYF